MQHVAHRASDEIHMLKAEIERLRAVEDAAIALVKECQGGDLPSSLGSLAKLERALIHRQESSAAQVGELLPSSKLTRQRHRRV